MPASPPRFVLALDQGTTGSRALVFDRAGMPVATAYAELTQHYPRPGWVEHDAEEIWRSQLAVAREALSAAGATAAEVAAIGITNQRETTVIWDRRTGEPIHRAIVWQDRRTADRCGQLGRAGNAPAIQGATGLLVDPYFSATKIGWLLDHVPGARARAEKGELAFGTVDSWLVWNLTGGKRHLTDVSNAARTSLFNLRRLDWDDAMLALFDVPRALLPEVVDCSGRLAETDPKWFGAALPIAGIAGDQQAATFGQACLRPGMAKNTYGTGLFLLMNTGREPIASSNRLLSTVGWRIPGERSYALEGSIFMGGATIQWLRDGLGLIKSAAEVEALAGECATSEGLVLVPAFAGLGAPYWDAYARGTMVGITRGTRGCHIARAALESIALQTVDILTAMEADSGTAVSELRVDGGASRNDLLMQIQADLLGKPVVRAQVTETTALGAAYLAGLGVGFWSGLAEIAAQWKAIRRFEPAMDAAAREAKIAVWRRAVERARAWEQPEGSGEGAASTGDPGP